ncbi:MAG: hypothetical protein MI923_10825 [Phycisphaerales bacterium]|nr:hypothetical protein [Phycisphaerales bacterium]
MFKLTARKLKFFNKFMALAMLAMLPMMTGCNRETAIKLYTIAFSYDLLLAPVRSVIGTALLSLINTGGTP